MMVREKKHKTGVLEWGQKSQSGHENLEKQQHTQLRGSEVVRTRTGSQATHANLFQIALAAEPIQRRT